VSRGTYGELGQDGECWPQMAGMVPHQSDEEVRGAGQGVEWAGGVCRHAPVCMWGWRCLPACACLYVGLEVSPGMRLSVCGAGGVSGMRLSVCGAGGVSRHAPVCMWGWRCSPPCACLYVGLEVSAGMRLSVCGAAGMGSTRRLTVVLLGSFLGAGAGQQYDWEGDTRPGAEDWRTW